MMFELLDTTGCYYLYDAVENQIVPISEEDAGKLSAYIKGDRTPEATECVERYQSMGLCTDKAVEELENPMNELAPYYLNERLENLILQVTQQCNLRCSYCVYSGKYINRTHNNSVMPYETACRAVDFFMARNLLVEKPSMGFYGGEPLLQFGLIKRIVGYVKENYPGREIQFNMTVNGTLLTDEVVDFLAENDFSLTLSIDGPKEIHDANRRFVSGQGSFDLIMEKLKYIREKYPDYFKKIMTNTVLSPDCDYEKALTFFEEQEYIRELHPRLGLVSPSGIKDANRVAYTGKWRELKDKNRAEVLYELSGGECCGEEDKKAYKILADYRDEIKRYHKSLKSGRLYLKKNHPSGPCVAGARRLFVTVDGDFYPCEKLPEIDELKIGTAEEGFDMEKVQNLMNIGKLTEERCKGCWAFQFCSLCAAACLTEEGISGDYREYACGDVRRHAKDMQKTCSGTYVFLWKADMIFRRQEKMKTLAVYSGSLDLNYFLKLEEMAALYGKVYVAGRSFLSGVNMLGDLGNVFFTENMEEVIEQVTDVLFYRDSEGIEEKIQYFAERGKKIYLYDVTVDAGQEYGEKVSVLSGEKTPQKKAGKRLYELPSPVVTVMGISEECERHKLFLEVSRAVEEQGYRVMKVSGQPVCRMGECIPLPEAVYAGRPLKERTLAFNHFLYRKVKEEKPDIVIIDVPGGILNQSLLEYTGDGEYAYMVGNAVDADASLLAIPAHEINGGFVAELKEICRQRFSANVAGIAMSCVGCKINIEEDRTYYFTVPAGFVKEKYIGEEEYIVPVKPLHGSGECFAEHLVAVLSDAG